MLSRIFFLLFIITISAEASSHVLITNIVKKDHQWQVEYESLKPVSSISFAHSPDDSRSTRWVLAEQSFKFIQSGGRELIIRKDNKSFSSVTLTFTPTYVHLPKYYAPFSPYSDGGVLLHSARFFACPELCSGLERNWYLTLTSKDKDNIYHNGQLYHGDVTWWDTGDGTKLYIGKQLASEEKSFVAIVDQALPTTIKQPLLSLFPEMMDSLELRYGKLKERPMLFASFGATQGDRYGRQGGVLNSQVFMHWYGKLPNMSREEQFELLWFYAHEAAHLYQGEIVGGIDTEHAWIHEGHAEFIALALVKQFDEGFTDLLTLKLEEAKTSCQSFLAKASLSNAAISGSHQVFYQCGLYIYALMNTDLADLSVIDDFWLALSSASANPSFNVKNEFLNLSKDKLSKEGYGKILKIVN